MRLLALVLIALLLALPAPLREAAAPSTIREDRLTAAARVALQAPRSAAPVAEGAVATPPAAPAANARVPALSANPSRTAVTAPGIAKQEASREAPAPVAGLRQLPPGSKAQSEAIAQALAAPEYEDQVAPVARLYLAFFDRIPDFEGFDHYVGERDRGTDLQAIAREFAGSAEFGMRYGNLDNAAFVDRVYENVFGQRPNDVQRAGWVAELESGRLDRGGLVLAFSEGADFRSVTANEVFVTLAYAETLRRVPDPADLSRWVAFLDAGNPREALVQRLLAANRPR